MKQRFNNRFETTKTYENSTGFVQTIITTNELGDEVQKQSFAFDEVGNLIRRTDNTPNNGDSTDILIENFAYDDRNRLTEEFFNDISKSYQYDKTGNITVVNDQDGTHNYLYAQTGNAGPHAVTSAKGNTYQYDNGGNVTSKTGTVTSIFTYTSFDKPYKIIADGWTSEIIYNASNSRYIRKDIKASRTITHYLGSVEYIYKGESKKAKRYIGNLIINIYNDEINRSSWGYQYLLKDHIGSTHKVVNKQGNPITVMSFDTWGARRKAPTPGISAIPIYKTYDLFGDTGVWKSLGRNIENTTNRGFTGHEHFDQVGIIHMNGRIYDPEIGRFLQADPIIQDPYNTQSLNRYSYVMNNPLSYTDPSGYFRLRKGWWRMPVAIALTVVTSGAASGTLFAGTAFGTFASANAFAVVITGGVLSGGVATGTLKGAVKGGVFAAITFGIGHGFGGKGIGKPGSLTRAVAHGVAGGVSAELDGGKFGHGFVSSVLSSGADKLGLAKLDHASTRIIANAIVAGTISELTGGKFANGAMSAAFRVAFNDALTNTNTGEPLTEYEQDKFEYQYITSLDGIADNVDNAIAQTGLFRYLVGRSGELVDEENRYIYLRKYNTLLDLQHVVSAAYNPFTGIGAGNAAGYALEFGQKLRGWESGMQAEDLFSNAVGSNIGFRHARIEASRYGKTVGWKVQQFILNSDPVLSSDKALSIYSNNRTK